uniref:Uncharacterized protein n=1 Tax=Arundo donax TaxID=35708 RepID=A0A0A8Z888_ARUDO
MRYLYLVIICFRFHVQNLSETVSLYLLKLK